jgi:hypothetical protein
MLCMYNSKNTDTLMVKNHILSVEQCPNSKKEKKQMENVPYSSVISSRIYAMICN